MRSDMILYGKTLSPFVARVRIALEAKGVACDLTEPPGGSTHSPEYLAINPIGKIPALVTEEGVVIPESETIIDYLEQRFPSPALLPASETDRARMGSIVRTLELYVTPALSRLFTQMDPATRSEAITAAEVQRFRDGLALVDRFVDDHTFAVGGALSKADCVLLPSLLLIEVMARLFALDDPFAGLPRLAGYRDKARTHPMMGRIWTETAEALAARTG